MKEIHLQVALRIVQYLKWTPDRGILFERNWSIDLEAYTDVPYAGSIVDRRPIIGYCTYVKILWLERVRNRVWYQDLVLKQSSSELIWLKSFLKDLKLKYDESMRLYCNNKSAISIAYNSIQYDRTKHNEVDRHFIKKN